MNNEEIEPELNDQIRSGSVKKEE
jgi:natural resistance-associated macrophage protein 2